MTEWLRVLPGKRYVGKAEWNGKTVLAKLLVGPGAGRQCRRETRGAARLSEHGLNSPALLAVGHLSGTGGWLLFEYLDGAESLGSRWRAVAGQPPLSASQEQVMGTALEAIGQMHARGVWQADLHLDNLLCFQNKLFWVDAGSIRWCKTSRALGSERAGDNLGLFFAQLPATFELFFDQLLKYYDRHAPRIDRAGLHDKVARARSRRLHDFLEKLGRDCSLFSVRRRSSELRISCRQKSRELEPLLSDPDRFIEAGEILKAGNSATVARIEVNGELLIAKRFNIKGFGHWLRRFWRPSRAWHAWREGHRLLFLGIPTAKPLAMLESRTCWLRGRAYLVTENVEGENILSRFAPYVNGSPPPEEVAALDQLFAALLRARISHGDLKGTNLIWHEGRWILIDLDGMHQHGSEQSFTRAYARDRARFLRNWPADSDLVRFLGKRIPASPLLSE